MATKKQEQAATEQNNQRQKSYEQSSPQQAQQTQSGGSQQSDDQVQNSQSGQTAQMQRDSGQGNQGGNSGLTRRGAFMPSLLAANPFELMRMSPFGLMRRFTDEMDRMFENFGTGGGSRGGTNFFAPQVEVFEREGNLVVRADLPGMIKDDVRVEVTDDGLLLEGERRSEHEENQGGFYRSERSYGSFRRFVPLPEGADVENATASFQNGVLEITMQAPQQRGQQRRRIEIQDTASAADESGGQNAASAQGGGAQAKTAGGQS